ncbi:MAG: AAA family ATPase [Bacteroidales bacterium]|jgi:predicted AAA+ superfamily ATPase|nr:AAA family ATPase [Bacteroidales bacterium]
MFTREALSGLRGWAAEKDRRPLVLRGVRQCGKTSLVKLFSADFDHYIYLNLEKSEHRKLFEEERPFAELIDAIFFQANIERNNGNTLVFIDEIQNSPAAVAKLRYFFEEAKELYVVAAGSLLETLIDKNISFPVGRVDFMPVRPCTFDEFLMITGEEKSWQVLSGFPPPDYAHEKLIQLFRLYTIIGGMPEILADYAESRDLQRLQKIYSRLIVSFQDDVEKYARNQTQAKVIRYIIGSAFHYAGKRITFDKFGGSEYRSREMGEAFRTLEKAYLLNLVYPVTATCLPAGEKLKKSPKLILFDTGLVNFSSGLQKELFMTTDIDMNYYRQIMEQVTAQELLTLDKSVRSRLNFWTREESGTQSELDFVYPYRDMLIPIEVKSGTSGKLRSLHQFIDRAPHSWSVRFYTGKTSVQDAKTLSGKYFKLINLPFYMAGRLTDVLKEVIG